MFQSYQNRPDLRSRAAMTRFLTNHFRYHTMNSWNRATSYANVVKFGRAGIPDDKYELALDVVFGNVQCPDWDDIRDTLIDEFTLETGFTAGFNGRSGGYLVLYDADVKTDANGCPKYAIHVGRSIDEGEDFENWPMSDLRERVRLVDRFDKLCDDLRDNFVAILENYEVRTDDVVVHHKVTTLVPREEEGDDA